MFENLSDKPVAAYQAEQVKKWNELDMLSLCVKAREGAPSFVFYEGPPTANGKPGIHHMMARTLKDSVNRYKTMRGFQVKRKGGWDTHGLPVEIEVEKALKNSTRSAVNQYSNTHRCGPTCQRKWLISLTWKIRISHIKTTTSKQAGGS